MAFNVVMPQMGESVAEGTIVRWLKKVGDQVDRDEPIFEITTDKVDAEIPAPESGVLLEIKVGAGETVPVGALVALIGSANEKSASAPVASSATVTPAQSEPVAQTQTTSVTAVAKNAEEMTAAELRRTKSTPVVRKIAEENGVNIQNISGSGLDGRVTRKDIENYISTKPAQTSAPAQISAPVQQSAPAPVQQSAPAAKVSVPSVSVSSIPKNPVKLGPNDTIEPMSNMRRVISDRMIESKAYSAHVHTCFEVDYTRVDQLRKKYKDLYAQRGAKLTFTTFLAMATIKALRAFPVINSSHDGENVIFHGDINLGIAVALDWGLLVPVIHQADELSVVGISKKIADLGDRARSKKLMPNEVQGLTFSITNPGIFGSQWGTPIIPQPSVAILGVGTIEKRVKVHTLADGTDTFVAKLSGYLTLGFDHRVIDGAVADQFMSAVKKNLENFDEGLL
jgi:pyruvate dehydrogenase E2 component (dihydrolipoamide acetyltransferase)